ASTWSGPCDGWPGWRTAAAPILSSRRRDRDLTGRADQGPSRGARAAAAPARREGGPHAEHAVADRVGPPHTLAPHPRAPRRRARHSHRVALRAGPAGAAARDAEE